MVHGHDASRAMIMTQAAVHRPPLRRQNDKGVSCAPTGSEFFCHDAHMDLDRPPARRIARTGEIVRFSWIGRVHAMQCIAFGKKWLLAEERRTWKKTIVRRESCRLRVNDACMTTSLVIFVSISSQAIAVTTSWVKNGGSAGRTRPEP